MPDRIGDAMDTREAKSQVEKAREVLTSKGAPIEGTAAGHLLLAIESLIENLDNSFGSTRKASRNGDNTYNFR